MIKIQNRVGMIINAVPDTRAIKYLSSKELQPSFLVNCRVIKYPKTTNSIDGSKLPKKSSRKEIIFYSCFKVSNILP